MAIDLKELEEKIDKLISETTPEMFWAWVEKKREAESPTEQDGKERDRAIARAAFEAGVNKATNVAWCISSGDREDESIPGLETYLNNL